MNLTRGDREAERRLVRLLSPGRCGGVAEAVPFGGVAEAVPFGGVAEAVPFGGVAEGGDGPVPAPERPGAFRVTGRVREGMSDRIPLSLRERRLVLPRAALGAVAVVVALALGVFVRTAHPPAAVPVPVAASTGSTPPGGGPGAASPVSSVTPTPGTSPTPPGGPPVPVIAHVVGQVHRPGVVHLPVGARVTDAVSAAGGVRRRADLTSINLARVVQDGEQIVVPAQGESPAAVPTPAVPGAAAVGGGTAAGTLVDLNTAEVAQLDTLPGIGPVLAARIVDWRTRNGRFTRVEELAEVRGIGEHLLGELRSLVTV